MLLKDSPLVKITGIILASILFYILLFNVTDNSDWGPYEDMFYGNKDSSDFLFNYLSNLFYKNRLDYSNLYQLHIALMGIGFIYFASRFNFSAVFSVITIYLMLQLIPLSNQIRYYVAFAFFLISAYNFIVTKNYIIFAIFATISFLSHSGILFMYPFIYLYYSIDSDIFLKKMIVFSLITGMSLYILVKIDFNFSNNLDFYLDSENVSSFMGGVYNILIWVFWLIYIYFNNKKLTMSSSYFLYSDVKYQFLYKLSLYSIIFIPIGLSIQIFAHRYVFASIIIWLSYIFYALEYENDLFQRIRSIIIFFLIVIASLFYVYILPTFVFGTSGTELVEELFMSNTTLLSILR
jgi:hypothetical protein